MCLIKSFVFTAALALQVSSAPLARRDLSCPGSNGQTFTIGSQNYVVECGTDRFQGDMPAPNGLWAEQLYDCMGQCSVREGCVMVNYVPSTKLCYLKSSVGDKVANEGVVGAVISNGGVAEASPSSPAQEDVPSLPESTQPTYNAPAVKGGKRGLCYNDASLTKLFGGKISWAYDWAQSTGDNFNTALTYVPMLWGGEKDRLEAWAKNAAAGIAAGADAVLGFNEPDLHEQANMDVGAAVSAWKSYIQPLAGKVKLISPAVTNGGNPMGLTYLKNFISACDGCQIDACAIHWYDSATNIQYFKNYMKDASTACGGKPIWITEFGASGSEDQIVSFLQEVLPWLDSQTYVERYAYFMAARGGNNLVNAAGNGLNAIGQAYNSL